MALNGKFVTRVIYLEDPLNAVPVATGADKPQSFFEVRPTDDPLAIADQLGRPVAILRLGGRLPEATGPGREIHVRLSDVASAELAGFVD